MLRLKKKVWLAAATPPISANTGSRDVAVLEP
jgi:hypothetical protein